MSERSVTAVDAGMGPPVHAAASRSRTVLSSRYWRHCSVDAAEPMMARVCGEMESVAAQGRRREGEKGRRTVWVATVASPPPMKSKFSSHAGMAIQLRPKTRVAPPSTWRYDWNVAKLFRREERRSVRLLSDEEKLEMGATHLRSHATAYATGHRANVHLARCSSPAPSPGEMVERQSVWTVPNRTTKRDRPPRVLRRKWFEMMCLLRKGVSQVEGGGRERRVDEEEDARSAVALGHLEQPYSSPLGVIPERVHDKVGEAGDEEKGAQRVKDDEACAKPGGIRRRQDGEAVEDVAVELVRVGALGRRGEVHRRAEEEACRRARTAWKTATRWGRRRGREVLVVVARGGGVLGMALLVRALVRSRAAPTWTARGCERADGEAAALALRLGLARSRRGEGRQARVGSSACLGQPCARGRASSRSERLRGRASVGEKSE